MSHPSPSKHEISNYLSNSTKGDVPSSWCCVMGNEANGISKPVVDACQHTIRIEMEPGVDSLSVPVATGILLNGLRERERKNITEDPISKD